ncbi:AAA domain-containing protein [Babesia ovata]|uniref:AAA domain-containing protein n=1 Tax=Babesia ovata TaxID=189622 RepID=A0A2H6KCX1_9APIC|nr:AAA domain-containing protein [Babesia ovata]GBE60824.1 AAA domain-containing protein [Babesia ovata]
MDSTDFERQVALQKRAIHVLSPSDNEYLGCRDAEAESLVCIMERCVEDAVGGSVFVFGLSGTGKTTTVHHAVNQFMTTHPKVRKISVSGNSFSSAWQFVYFAYDKLARTPAAQKRMLEKTPVTERRLDYNQLYSMLHAAFKTAPAYTICIMDEVDYLSTYIYPSKATGRSNWMLQAIIAASHAPGSRVLIIAISNNLELATLITEKQCRVIRFKPYKEQQIIAIIKGKLAKLDAPYTSVINDTAILLLARRVANTSGDIRACLDTFTRAISNSLSNLEEEIDRLTSSSLTDYATSSENSTPERFSEEASTPKRCYGDESSENIKLSSYQVGHKDVGSLTPTLSLSKTSLLTMKVKPLPLMQLLALLSVCKSALDEEAVVLSFRSIKRSLLHLADMLVMDKVDVEDFCTSKFSDAIDIFMELGILKKPSNIETTDADEAPGDELVSLCVDASTLVKVVLPISPAFVGLDLEFPVDECSTSRYSNIAKSFNIQPPAKKSRRKLR